MQEQGKRTVCPNKLRSILVSKLFVANWLKVNAFKSCESRLNSMSVVAPCVKHYCCCPTHLIEITHAVVQLFQKCLRNKSAPYLI